jgi:AcrR family transcriptional regulator
MRYHPRMKIKQALDFDEAPDKARPDDAASDRGARARGRLLWEATRIFSEKGFAKASTREICQAAGLNVASIHYYFGDKAGLYRAVLCKPLEDLGEDFEQFDEPGLPLRESLQRFMAALLCPWGQDELSTWVMRVHLREMVEPTPDYKDVMVSHIQPYHQRLVLVLARHAGASKPDDALHQLAFALVAMVQDYGVSREFMQILAPTLLKGPKAMMQVLERLVGYGEALVEHEARVRASAAPRAPSRTAPEGQKKRTMR